MVAGPSPLFSAFLNYSDPNAVFLTVEPAIINGAVSFNERLVALQLDTLTPATGECAFEFLYSLSPAQVTQALDQLSGDPNTRSFHCGDIEPPIYFNVYMTRPLTVTTSPFCRDIDPCNLELMYGWKEAGTGLFFKMMEMRSVLI